MVEIQNIEKLKKIRVVYVEDEKEVRDNISRILRRRLGDIKSAEDGLKGLGLVLQEKPDIIITDIEMPNMNGIEMISKLRNEHNVDVPVIVLTAYRDNEHKTEFASKYIYKPVDIKNLLKTINDSIDE
jgi:response regulator RpfG family c-di-GMP phosphodiesterase